MAKENIVGKPAKSCEAIKFSISTPVIVYSVAQVIWWILRRRPPTPIHDNGGRFDGQMTYKIISYFNLNVLFTVTQ